MMVRSPMQVDEGFRQRIKKIQEAIMRKKGKFTSFPIITREIINMPEWEIMEKKLLGEIKQMGLRIKLDGRQRQ